jgi:toxin ParE1/3/4
MRSVVWFTGAESDLEQIVDYVAIDNIQAALLLARRIVGAVEESLPHNPNMGRPGRVGGTRELIVHKNYIVIYEVSADAINILEVIHAARLYPTAL